MYYNNFNMPNKKYGTLSMNVLKFEFFWMIKLLIDFGKVRFQFLFFEGNGFKQQNVEFLKISYVR